MLLAPSTWDQATSIWPKDKNDKPKFKSRTQSKTHHFDLTCSSIIKSWNNLYFITISLPLFLSFLGVFVIQEHRDKKNCNRCSVFDTWRKERLPGRQSSNKFVMMMSFLLSKRRESCRTPAHISLYLFIIFLLKLTAPPIYDFPINLSVFFNCIFYSCFNLKFVFLLI